MPVAADPDRLSSFDYTLPRELIAQHPTENRVDARLMVVDRTAATFSHHHIRDLPELLVAGDTLVMNNSRVVPARLMGYRTLTRGRWQGLFLDHDAATGCWEVLTKTRGTLRPDETITIVDRDGRDGMRLIVVSRTDDGHLIVRPEVAADPTDGDPAGDAAPEVWLERYGRVPIPPYIRDGHMVDRDVTSYQTVYAKHAGSVAAPTAGLHFTPPLLESCRAAGVGTVEVTLHVGLGTFRPIAVDDLNDHRMHHERVTVTPGAAAEINDRKSRGRTIAVGTTSARTLESASRSGTLQPFDGPTDLFIRPGYRWNTVDAMLTNFHLPKSSLLVMVSALAGRQLILDAYREAIEQEYRFYSYGDAMLIV